MEIDNKLIDHLCLLARLSLSPRCPDESDGVGDTGRSDTKNSVGAETEKESLKKDLSQILSYIETLKTVDVTDIKPLTHSTEGTDGNIWRKDKVVPGIGADKTLQNAPSQKGNFFDVPKVIE